MERRAANAPAPGAKPNRQRKAQGALSDGTSGEIDVRREGTEISDADGAAVDGKPHGDKSGQAGVERGATARRVRERHRAQARGPRSESVDRSSTIRWNEGETDMTDADTTERSDELIDERERHEDGDARDDATTIWRSDWSPRARSPATTSRSCWTCWTSTATSIWTSKATARW